MQINSKQFGSGKAGSSNAYSTSSKLTAIGLTKQGHFFRELLSYSLEVDGFHFVCKHDVAEQSSLLLEIEDPDPKSLPTKVQAKVVSVRPSASSPGMFDLIAQTDRAKAPSLQKPNASAPVSVAPPAPVQPVLSAPQGIVAPIQPKAEPIAVPPPTAPASSEPGPAPQPAAPSSASASAVQDKADQFNLNTFAHELGFEVLSAPLSPEPEQSITATAQESLDAAVRDLTERYVREQFSSRLQTQADDLSGQLKKRVEEESERIAGECREKFRQAMEKDLQKSQARVASTAIILEQLRAQAAKEFEARQAELRVIHDRAGLAAQSVLDKLSVEAESIASRCMVRAGADLQTKMEAAQRALDVQIDQSKKQVADLLGQLEAPGLGSIAHLSNAQAQMILLRSNLETEMGAANSWMAGAIQEAMSRLSAEVDIRIADGLHEIDSDLRTKLAGFQESVSQQLDACRGQSVEQMRKAWQSEMRDAAAKLQEMSRRMQSWGSVETTRLFRAAMGSLEVKIRERLSEMEASCTGIAAQAAQPLEVSSAKLKEMEAVTANLLEEVAAASNRTKQAVDALNAMQASLESNFQQRLAKEMENLSALYRKQLGEQCEQTVALQLSTLEQQVAAQVQPAEQSLKRLAEEQKEVEAACRTQQEMLRAESKQTMEEVRSGVAQATESLRTEVANAARMMHEALEKEIASKIKFLADNATNLVRRLFHQSSE